MHTSLYEVCGHGHDERELEVAGDSKHPRCMTWGLSAGTSCLFRALEDMQISREGMHRLSLSS